MNEQNIKTTSASVRYSTMTVLVISNLLTLWLGTGFAAVYGQGIGTLSSMIETQAVLAAAVPLVPVKIQPQVIDDQLRAVILSDPHPALVVGGSKREVGRFSLQAGAQPVYVRSLSFTIMPPDQEYPARLGIAGDARNIQQLEVWQSGASAPLAIVNVNNNPDIMVTLQTPILLKAGMSREYSVKARFATVGVGSAVRSGSGIALKLSGVGATDQTGEIAMLTSGLGRSFYTFSSFQSVPTVTIQNNTVTPSISGAAVDLIKFSTSANAAGPLGLAKFSFAITGTGAATGFNNLMLYVSDSASAIGNLVANTPDIVVTSAPDDPSALYARARFDVNNDAPYPHTAPGSSEALIVYPGSTKYFTLRGTPTQNATGNYITYMVEDQGFSATIPLNVLAIEQSSFSSTIWSDLNFYMYSSTTATQTEGWFNGYRVDGLPMGAP